MAGYLFGIGARLQGAENFWSDGAMLRSEELVTGRHSKTVGLANSGAGDDFESLGPRLAFLARLAGHLTDDGDLLEIFLPEKRFLRSDEIEKTADNLSDAVEVAPARGAFHNFVQFAEIEHAGVGLRIDLLDGRDENNINTLAGKQEKIFFQCAGIVLKVGGVVELSGVYKYADHGVWRRSCLAFGVTITRRFGRSYE